MIQYSKNDFEINPAWLLGEIGNNSLGVRVINNIPGMLGYKGRLYQLDIHDHTVTLSMVKPNHDGNILSQAYVAEPDEINFEITVGIAINHQKLV